MNKTHFAGLLDEFRLRAGLSQDQLARALGVHSSLISRWKSDEYVHHPGPEHIRVLATILRLSPREEAELRACFIAPPPLSPASGPRLTAPTVRSVLGLGALVAFAILASIYGLILPSSAPSTAARHEALSIDYYRGALLFEAPRDAAPSVAPRMYTGDSSASDMHVLPGVIEIVISGAGGNTYSRFELPARDKYIVEFDLAFEPGSRIVFAAPLVGFSPVVDIFVSSGSETVYLAVVSGPPGEPITERTAVDGLAAGRMVTVGAAVEPSGYRLFVDGRLVAQAPPVAGVAAPRAPGFGAASASTTGTGIVRILGARVYALAARH